MTGSKLDPFKWTVRSYKSRKPFVGSGNRVGFRATSIRFKVMDPTHRYDDNDRVWCFDTHAEAISFAQREALREKLIEFMTEWLSDDKNFDDIMVAWGEARNLSNWFGVPLSEGLFK